VFLKTIGVLLNKITNSYIVYTIINYSENIAEETGIVFFFTALVKRLVFITIFMYFIRGNGVRDKLIQYLFNIYFFTVCFYALLNGTGVFKGLTTYFTIVEIIIWGRLFQFINKTDKKITFAVVFLNGIFNICSALFTQYSSLYLPYISIFNIVERNAY
jgi:hypothetical protein